MSKWQSGIIHPSARYRTQPASQSRGVYNLKEQLQHVNAENWQKPFVGWPDNGGQRIPVTLIETTTGADNADDFSVHHESMDAAVLTGNTGRVYFSVKVTASTVYYNDLCIGAVQLVSNNYAVLNHSWDFETLSDYTAWDYATVTGLQTVNSGYENYSDIIAATSQSWASCVNGTANARVSRNTGTPSTRTGAADGIPVQSSVISSGTTSIAQSSGDYYMYTESSGSPQNTMNDKWFWMRSPEVTLDANLNKEIVIAYHACTSSGGTGMTDAADEPLFRWWWIPS